jgi:hypothetical protein
MQFDRKCKLEKAVAKSEGRYAMRHTLLAKRGDEHVLVATDGRILAVVGVEVEEGDAIGLIPVEAVKGAAKGGQSFMPAQIHANGSAVYTDKAGAQVTMARPEGEFPRWESIMPAPQADDIVIALNPDLLKALADAIGADGCVQLRIRAVGGKCMPIAVKGGKGEGAIMPITFD